MKNIFSALLFIISLSAYAAPEVLFKNYRIHTVKTQDGVGLKVLELLGNDKQPMVNARPIVLMHGFTSNWNSWYLIADSYRAAGLRVFAVNWRGHGQGSHRSIVLNEQFNTHDPRYNFHRLPTQDVPAVIDFAYRTSGGKKVIYQSHSMGGMMANLAFAGLTMNSNGKVSMSLLRGRELESKLHAYIPIAAPNSLQFNDFPGSNLIEVFMDMMGVNGDRSDDIELPFRRTRATAMYWSVRANPLLRGLLNLSHMSVDEFSLLVKFAASDVPRALSENMSDMRRQEFYGPEDRSVDYASVSQYRSLLIYRSRVPTLMLSASLDALALIDQQNALAARKKCKHVVFNDAGHVDIVFGQKWSKQVVENTLGFLKNL